MRVKKKLTIIDMHIISTKVKVLFLPFGLLNDFLAMFFDIIQFNYSNIPIIYFHIIPK